MGVKISALPSGTQLLGNEPFPGVQAGQTRQFTVDQISGIQVAIIVIGAGTVIVNPNTTHVVINKPAPSATPCQLPSVASRLGRPLLIFDFAGNGGSITAIPATNEVINGLAPNATWDAISSGPGLNGSLWLIPVTGIGWCVR